MLNLTLSKRDGGVDFFYNGNLIASMVVLELDGANKVKVGITAGDSIEILRTAVSKKTYGDDISLKDLSEILSLAE